MVHYLPPLVLEKDNVTQSEIVRERPLRVAVNDVLEELGVSGGFSVEDADVLGYRLLFGGAALPHVGRGLTYLLPVVEVGLLGDPYRFSTLGADVSLDDFLEGGPRAMLVALEEPESHLHPKVQSRLANWLVSLARCQRQFIVESHSDHFVRRLRGLVARAGTDSPLERWLLSSVKIYSVAQAGGVSTLTPMRMTATGSLEEWPEDFMDEASEEDSVIYLSSLEKSPPNQTPSSLVHDEGGDEPSDIE